MIALHLGMALRGIHAVHNPGWVGGVVCFECCYRTLGLGGLEQFVERVLTTKCGEGAYICPSHLFLIVEQRRSLIAQKIAKTKYPSGKILRNSILLFKKIYPQKTVFALPLPTLSTLARQIHVDIC